MLTEYSFWGQTIPIEDSRVIVNDGFVNTYCTAISTAQWKLTQMVVT